LNKMCTHTAPGEEAHMRGARPSPHLENSLHAPGERTGPARSSALAMNASPRDTRHDASARAKSAELRSRAMAASKNAARCATSCKGHGHARVGRASDPASGLLWHGPIHAAAGLRRAGQCWALEGPMVWSELTGCVP